MAIENRCELIIQRDRFSEELSKQIAQGKILLDIKILSAPANLRGWENVIGDPYKEQKERLSQQYTIWNDYNKELLRRSFNDPDNDYFETYSNAGNLRLLERSDYFTLVQKIISDEITVLESLLNKIDLIPCSAIVSSNNIKETEVDSNKVFIVHGHDTNVRNEVELFVRSIGYDPIILCKRADKGNTIIEKIECEAKDVCYAIVIYTSCDLGKDKNADELQPRARQNVVFEHGFMCAHLGRSRVCALLEEGVEQPGDLQGVIYKHLDSSGAWRYQIADEMKAIGLNVDKNLIK